MLPILFAKDRWEEVVPASLARKAQTIKEKGSVMIMGIYARPDRADLLLVVGVLLLQSIFSAKNI